MFLVAAALPMLFWDAGLATAPALRDAHIDRIAVPAAQAEQWKSVPGITAETVDPQTLVKLLAPAVEYRPNQATASRSPWIDSNGWLLLRRAGQRFYYDAPGKQAALAAAEAFAYGAEAVVRTDAAGLKPFAEMLDFLRGVAGDPMPALADIAYVDDGSDTSAEVLNLMARNNLLVELARPGAPVSGRAMVVRLGTKDFPLEEAADPKVMEHIIRSKLTDEKRSLRMYGTEVALARVAAAGDRLRVMLLNYDGARRTIQGVRVRVLGRYPEHRVAAAGSPGIELMDYALDDQGTEFTLPELKTFAVVDLSR